MSKHPQLENSSGGVSIPMLLWCPLCHARHSIIKRLTTTQKRET